MIERSRSRVLRPYICLSCAKHIKQRSRKLATAASPDIYDVVCVGGGPAGLSLLTALRASKSTSHLRLALVESQDLTSSREWHLPPDQYSNRTSSLTPASFAYLSTIGAWTHIDTSRIQPYRHMRVWDALSSNGRISFDSRAPDPPIARMTENNNLTRALLARLDELPSFATFDKNKVEHIQLGKPPLSAEPSASSLNLSSYPHITLSSKQTLAARLLVGADGLNSPVRSFAGIPTRGWDYDRHAVVATLQLSSGTDHNPEDPRGVIAWQRFLPSGPLALLALPGNYTTLVWTNTPERAARLKSLSTDDFVAMVNAAFRLEMVDLDYMFTLDSGQADEFKWRTTVSPSTTAEACGDIPQLVECVQPNSIASFPLRLRHASTYTTHRAALIGDAAHSIHPLAGQGLNMGLADSRALASAIEYAVQHGADIGNEMNCLDRYNSEMWVGNNRMLGAVDKLHWLYSTSMGPVVGLRGLGLKVVDQMGGLKEWFMQHAGGV